MLNISYSILIDLVESLDEICFIVKVTAQTLRCQILTGIWAGKLEVCVTGYDWEIII